MFELRELFQVTGPFMTLITSDRYRGPLVRPNAPEAVRFRILMGQVLDHVLDALTACSDPTAYLTGTR